MCIRDRRRKAVLGVCIHGSLPEDNKMQTIQLVFHPYGPLAHKKSGDGAADGRTRRSDRRAGTAAGRSSE